MGASLAVVTDEAEDEFVCNLIKSKQSHAWLGASDEDLEGSWLWVTGTEWNFTLWMESNQIFEQNDCLLRSQYGWEDHDCTDIAAYVCE
ncbi:hepatic lectin-like [Mya arenaria]|uniref:hepatic lectin-like n=1 Tax=Mya arenaria TaxID=6604 RepID=UPI0022E98B91|nr:hepatic lectin-like [Mya arenaria]XP_052761890.1 hepatic lectin-like [Mya arenaria]